MSFSETQLRAMAWSPKFASSLSILGSSFIIAETIRDHRSGRGCSVMQRAVCGMSIVDVLASLGWFLSTWAAPEGLALNSFGNEATCRFQGFLLQIAIGAPLYNGALMLYYLLVIKYKWSNDRILKLEPYLHVFIWIWCIGTSIVLLSLDLMNFIGPVCWVSDPPTCFEDEPSGDCGRAKRYATWTFCVPLWIVIVMTIYALCNIYFAVREADERMQKYSFQGKDIQSRRRSSRDVQKVALRAVLYSVAFVITWTASTIWSVAQYFDYYPFWVSYLWTLMEPLQGSWNACIFLYNRPDSRKRLQWMVQQASCGLLFPLAEPEDPSSPWRRSSNDTAQHRSSDEEVPSHTEGGDPDKVEGVIDGGVARHKVQEKSTRDGGGR